jgi:hypothetical protein
MPGNPFTWLIVSGTGIVQTQFGADKDSAIIKLTGTGPTWTIGVYQEIEISPGVLCQSLTQTLVVNRYGAPTVTGPPVVCVDAITTFTATGPTPPGGYQWSILPPYSNRGTVIGPQGLSTANIRWHGPPAVGVTVVASNCGGSGSATVTIANPPAIPLITASGPVTYCYPALPASTFALSVPNVYASYQWYGPGGLVTGATNSSYTPAPGTFPPAGGSFIFTVVVSNGICSVSAKIQILIGTCSGVVAHRRTRLPVPLILRHPLFALTSRQLLQLCQGVYFHTSGTLVMVQHHSNHQHSIHTYLREFTALR